MTFSNTVTGLTDAQGTDGARNRSRLISQPVELRIAATAPWREPQPRSAIKNASIRSIAERFSSNPAFQEDAHWPLVFGGQHQGLNIVGIGVDEVTLCGRLERCMLTDEELAWPERRVALLPSFLQPKESA